MVQLTLYNGSKTKEAWNPKSPEFIDDWKPEQRVIIAECVQVTYQQHVKVYAKGNESVLDLFFEDELLVYDGIYYGDFSIVAADA